MKVKSSHYLLLFLLLQFPYLLKAQETPKNVIKWNPFALALGTFTFGYERILNNKLSLQGTINLTGFRAKASGPNNSGEISARGLGIIPELRYYAFHNTTHPPKGFYAGAFLLLQGLNGEIKSDSGGTQRSINGKLSRFGAGGIIGYQFLIKQKITIDLFLGPMYVNNDLSADINLQGYKIPFDATVSKIEGRGGITVGLAF